MKAGLSGYREGGWESGQKHSSRNKVMTEGRENVIRRKASTHLNQHNNRGTLDQTTATQNKPACNHTP